MEEKSGTSDYKYYLMWLILVMSFVVLLLPLFGESTFVFSFFTFLALFFISTPFIYVMWLHREDKIDADKISIQSGHPMIVCRVFIALIIAFASFFTSFYVMSSKEEMGVDPTFFMALRNFSMFLLVMSAILGIPLILGIWKNS